jgi:diacylglycerol kinase family enzyme
LVREKTGKAPNYTVIAIKGLLYKFKPVNAKVTVDGVTEEYKNVWMVPTMNGRYFGGGMMVAPEQDRLNAEHELTVVVVPCKSRLRLLTVFPKIFEGKHVKYTKIFKTFRGKNVTVEFDNPTALQIDGETVLGVTKYSAESYSEKKECATV